MVDFDLSTSKLTIGGFLPGADSPLNQEKSGLGHGGGSGNIDVQRQGSDSQLPSAIKKQNESHNLTMINRSSTLNKSSNDGGGVDELAMSMDDTDFGLSESNFSHSMMSNKINQFQVSRQQQQLQKEYNSGDAAKENSS